MAPCLINFICPFSVNLGIHKNNWYPRDNTRMIWFSILFCFTLGLTASGKSFFKKKKPEPETSTPIREDQTTSIRDKKPDLDSSDDSKKMASPAERRTKNKREVSASVQEWGGGTGGRSTHWFWQLKDLSIVQKSYRVLEGRGKSFCFQIWCFDMNAI